MVREQGEHTRVVAEHLFDEAVQRLLWSHLDEHPRPVQIQRLQTLHELHGRRHLPAQDVDHLGFHARSHRIEVPTQVGHDRDLRRAEVEPGQYLLQRRRGGGHDRGVKGVAHRQQHHVMAGAAERGNRLFHRDAGPADDGLAAAVDVGDDDVAVDAGEDLFHLPEWSEDGGHQAPVLDLEVDHLPAARAHRFERIGERQGAGSYQSPVLAEAVAHHEIRAKPVFRQEPGDGAIDRQHRWLGDLGAAQVLVGLGHRGLVVGVDEHVVAQGPPGQQRLHDPVGLVEDLGDGRIGLRQRPQHVGVLRTLSGVEEGHLRPRAAASEDATRPQQLPGSAVAGQGPLRPPGLVGQFLGGAEVDGDPLGSAQRHRGG